jgi:hypothetical protein
LKVNKHVGTHPLILILILVTVTVLAMELSGALPLIQTPRLPQCLQLLQRAQCHHRHPLIHLILLELHPLLKGSLLSSANMLVISMVTSLLNLALPLPVHQVHLLTAMAQWVGVVDAVEDPGVGDGVLQAWLTTTPLALQDPSHSLIMSTVQSVPR